MHRNQLMTASFYLNDLEHCVVLLDGAVNYSPQPMSYCPDPHCSIRVHDYFHSEWPYYCLRIHGRPMVHGSRVNLPIADFAASRYTIFRCYCSFGIDRHSASVDNHSDCYIPLCSCSGVDLEVYSKVGISTHCAVGGRNGIGCIE